MAKTHLNKPPLYQKIALPGYLIMIFIINIAIIFFILLTKNKLPPVVPLFYGVAYGTERLAPVNYLILPSLLSITVIFVNSLLSIFIDDIFLKKTLSLAALAITVFSSITTFKIMLLVGNYI